MSEGKSCLVCSGGYSPASLAGLLACHTCGFLTADLALSETELKSLYGHDYFHGHEYHDYEIEKGSLQHNFKQRLHELLHYLPNPKACSLLEIGCAYGFFLEMAKPIFKSVEGVDIAETAILQAQLRGLPAVAQEFLEYPISGLKDVVVLWDVIEHLAHPDRYMQKIASALKPGGLVALTTGDIGSFNARMRGKKWRMIHPPTHLHYFSKKTMRVLLEKNGFEIIHFAYPGNARTIRSILYGIFVLRLNKPTIFKWLAKLPGLDWAITINLYDIMCVIARKRA